MVARTRLNVTLYVHWPSCVTSQVWIELLPPSLSRYYSAAQYLCCRSHIKWSFRPCVTIATDTPWPLCTKPFLSQFLIADSSNAVGGGSFSWWWDHPCRTKRIYPGLQVERFGRGSKNPYPIKTQLFWNSSNEKAIGHSPVPLPKKRGFEMP